MGHDFTQLILKLNSPLAVPEALNFRLPSWPPPRDFPVVVDKAGLVVSRYKDPSWDISVWGRRARTLYFENGKSNGKSLPIDRTNADLLRRTTAWIIWGPRGTREADTLNADFHLAKPLFLFCSNHKILPNDLNKNPHLLNKFIKETKTVRRKGFIPLMEFLFSQKDMIGATLLDRSSIRKLPAKQVENPRGQFAYIPPRILKYHTQRLKEFLLDYSKHQDSIERLFDFCIESYRRHEIARQIAKRMKKWACVGPFTKPSPHAQDFAKEIYIGRFADIAAQYGVDELIRKWCPNQNNSTYWTITKFSHYLTMVNFVGMAYILSFSPMRIGEAWELRSNSFIKHRDPDFGDIFILSGRCLKSSNDEGIWVTSPTTKIAVDALTSVARLRAKVQTSVKPDALNREEPIRLASEATEPWTSKRPKKNRGLGFSYPQHSTFILRNPQFFDQSETTITREDLDLARLVGPTLNSKRFRIGEAWPFSWHQLRRTLSVNMLASDLVSEASLQFELKHASRAMCLYYGQGYSSMKINEETRKHYLKAFYELLGQQIANLFADRFVSPYGNDRKSAILNVIGTEDCKKLESAAKAGKISWRVTLLGGCTRRGPCPYGGVDNIARCAGGDGKAPCVDGLFDREREPQLRELKETISSRLASTTEESPYRTSLVAQLSAVENALNVFATR
ncbi:hypothetical protein N5I87_21775 [Ralstonia sp. CHL-2022]|uniref:Integrase n=1 Tax=Ralstonia mojiangensis TaxID=2953895 RepID=A0AAE3I7I9_9RALS|nr:hypothetical protein [Ralstonia mojiangensis]MCT7318657.1 hypothetical protein [Ralstonia mojiangensis]